MHNNASLTGVQKLSYLRGQLQGEAARVIADFQLTNANYQHFIDLLKDCIGQPHKQIEAHMQALIDIHSPSGTLNSLHEFTALLRGTSVAWIRLENHRTLTAAYLSLSFLGKFHPRSNRT